MPSRFKSSGKDDRAQRGRAAPLVLVAVSALADDEFVTPCTVTEQRQQVALGAAGAKDRALGSKEIRSEFLESIDRRVLPIDVVSDIGAGHDCPHGFGRLRDRVASQVDRQRCAPGFAAVIREAIVRVMANRGKWLRGAAL